MQYFLGYRAYQYKQPFSASLLVSIRRRLGEKAFTELTMHFMNQVHRIEAKIESAKKESTAGKKGSKPVSGSKICAKEKQAISEDKPTNKGHLMVDATVAPSDIKYPTDLDLLNEAREKSERLIDLLYVPAKGKVKPRTYRMKARRDYLSVTKQRKKCKRTIRKAIRLQLNYLGRNLRTIEKLLDEKQTQEFPLAHKHQKTYWVIQELYRQQQQMYKENTHKISGRIVSISQPHIRPIVRGKSGREVEFGAKISVSADVIFGSRENWAYMKQQGINYSGISLGRRPRELTPERKELEAERKKKAKQRSQVEGVFGVGKRKYDLGLVKAKTKETSESWIGMHSPSQTWVYLIMNIARLMRVIFWPFFKIGDIARKKSQNYIRFWQTAPTGQNEWIESVSF